MAAEEGELRKCAPIPIARCITARSSSGGFRPTQRRKQRRRSNAAKKPLLIPRHPRTRRHCRRRTCRLMKRDLLFVVERLAGLVEERRLEIVARQHGIKREKDSDSLAKLFDAYLRRAEESVLGSVLVELTVLLAVTRQQTTQVLNEAATLYKVDTDAIAAKVKQEFAAKDKAKAAKKAAPKSPTKQQAKAAKKSVAA